MIDTQELAYLTSKRFNRVYEEVFQGEPAANEALEVEVLGSAMAGDTPVLVLITPWTLNGLAFPPDDRFPNVLVVNKRRCPVFSHELVDLGPYRVVNLVSDVSGLANQNAARHIAAGFIEPFRVAVERARSVAGVPNPGRRSLLGLSGSED